MSARAGGHGELEKKLREQQAELQRREAALPDLADGLAIFEEAREKLEDAGLNDIPAALALAIADDRLSLKSAYVQRLSSDAKNMHTSNYGVRYPENVAKVWALAGARPSAMGALDSCVLAECSYGCILHLRWLFGG